MAAAEAAVSAAEVMVAAEAVATGDRTEPGVSSRERSQGRVSHGRGGGAILILQVDSL
jgi:hypothetical protein